MDHLFNTFVVLFIVIDPIGIAAVFMVLLRGADRAYQRSTAIKSTALATAILLVFFFIGDELLRVLGIDIAAFRIAGGILLFLLSIDMVFARQSGLRSTTAREQEEAQQRQDVSVFPLAFPLISGPGAMTTVLLMASASATQPIATFVGTLLVLLLVLAMTLVSLLLAPSIMYRLGETGANVISRLFGLILAALAVQYIVDGVKTYLA